MAGNMENENKIDSWTKILISDIRPSINRKWGEVDYS